MPAALIDSGVTPKQRQSIYDMAHGGGLRILYVAPERLWTDDFLFFAQSTRIDLMAVDEAHCVLQWGNDFRSSYLHIGEFIAGLPSRPVVAAFTATATRGQVPEIAEKLGLDQPVRIGTGFDRPNIRFDALKLKPSARKQFILDWAKTKQEAASSTAPPSAAATTSPKPCGRPASKRKRSTRPSPTRTRPASRTGSSPARLA